MTAYDDPDLPFILRPDNVSRYEDGSVLILDRRVYPFEVRYEHCRTYEETAEAIENMVTQSAGPGLAAMHGMIQAAHEARGRSRSDALAILERAAQRLVATRPTNNQIRRVVGRLLEAGRGVLEADEDLESALAAEAEIVARERYEGYRLAGEIGASILDDGDVVLTHCWGEGGITFSLLTALRQGKQLEAICTETRPYLQGSRLAADVIAELGIPTTVVTDGMHGSLMAAGRVSKFLSGADRVTTSGQVVNKVGTFPIALMAGHFGIPYYAFSVGPDTEDASSPELVVEERDPEETLHCMGNRTATTRAGGYYPAFDVTPREFVTGVITKRGLFSPDALPTYGTQEPDVAQ